MRINKFQPSRDQQLLAAQKFFVKNYSREERWLIILQRDLQKGFTAINAVGIEKSKDYQFYYDFPFDFESLKEKMNEFGWSKKMLKSRGINYNRLEELYNRVRN